MVESRSANLSQGVEAARSTDGEVLRKYGASLQELANTHANFVRDAASKFNDLEQRSHGV